MATQKNASSKPESGDYPVGYGKPPKVPFVSVNRRAESGVGESLSVARPAATSVPESLRSRQPRIGSGPIQPASRSDFGSCGGSRTTS